MKSVIYTLCERDYDIGVGILINSLCQVGYKGRFHIYFRGNQPRWLSALKKISVDEWEVRGIRLTVECIDPPRHLGYQKPFAGCDVIDRFDPDYLFYFDPDIVLLANWEFFERWVDCGVAVCMDCNTPLVSALHPWRSAWETICNDAGIKRRGTAEPYYFNSGCVGLSRKNFSLMEAWCKITTAFEQGQGTTKSFDQANATKPVRGDQELLAASIQSFEGNISWLGPEAMGFTGYSTIMNHQVGMPKPWTSNFTRNAIRGRAPDAGVHLFIENMNGEIQVVSKVTHLSARVDLTVAKLIARVWKA